MDEETIQEQEVLTNADLEPEAEKTVVVSEYNRIQNELQREKDEKAKLLDALATKQIQKQPLPDAKAIGQEIFNAYYQQALSDGKEAKEAAQIANDKTAVDMLARENEMLKKDLYTGYQMLEQKIEEAKNPTIRENQDQIAEARKLVPEYDHLPVKSKANILAMIPKKPSGAPAIFVEPSKTKTTVTTKGTSGTRYAKGVEQPHNHDIIFTELLADRGAKKEDYIARVNASYEGRRR